MSAHCRTLVLAVAALLLPGGLGHAFAKPPELPVDLKVICQPGWEQPTEAGPTSDAEEAEDSSPGRQPSGQKSLDGAEDMACETLDTTCPCWCQALQSCWRQVVHHLTGVGMAPEAADEDVGCATDRGGRDTADPGAGVPSAPSTASKVVCPYLQRQALERKKMPPGMGAETTVLDNLRKLEQARKALRQAERFQEDGELDLARDCYEQVHRLCPGSPADQRALLRLSRLNERAAATGGSAEEAEPGSGSDKEDLEACPENGGAAVSLQELLQGRLCAQVGGVCVETDGSQPGCLRVQGSLQVAGFTLRVMRDSDGSQTFVVLWLPGPLANLPPELLPGGFGFHYAASDREPGGTEEAEGAEDPCNDGCEGEPGKP